MYIYQLQNFEGKDYLFTRKGERVISICHYLHGSRIKDDRDLVHYISNKTNKSAYKLCKVLKKVIDFNTLSDEVKGLFVINKYNIIGVKNSMTENQWKTLLKNYSI